MAGGDGLEWDARRWLGIERFLMSAQLKPQHAPLRFHPRFQALLERYAVDVERD